MNALVIAHMLSTSWMDIIMQMCFPMKFIIWMYMDGWKLSMHLSTYFGCIVCHAVDLWWHFPTCLFFTLSNKYACVVAYMWKPIVNISRICTLVEGLFKDGFYIYNNSLKKTKQQVKIAFSTTQILEIVQSIKTYCSIVSSTDIYY